MKAKLGKLLLWAGVFALLGLVILWIEHGRCAAQLAAYQRTLTARGDKLTLRELLPPDPPASSNAMVALDGILSRFPMPYVEDSPWMQLVSSNRARVSARQNPLIQDAQDLTWEELAQKAGENASHLSNVLAAAALPRLAFLTRANLDQLMADSQQAYQLDPLGQWLGLNALVAAREGRTNDAWEAWRAQLRLRSLALNDPATIFDERWIRPTAFTGSWELLQHANWTETQLAEAQALWETCRHLRTGTGEEQFGRALVFQSYDEFRRQPAIVASIVGASAMSTAMSSASGGADWWDTLLTNPKAVWGFLSDAVPRMGAWPWWTSYGDELWMLHEYDRFYAAVQSSVGSHTALPALAKLRATTPPPPSVWWPLARAAVEYTPMEQMFLKVVAQETQTRLVVTAIALRRHQLRHQRLPETLGTLVPDFLARVPEDPMDGKPLRYRPQPDGTFLLYSVGEDGIDQGGDATRRAPPSVSSTVFVMSSMGVDDSRWQQGLDWIWPLPATAETLAEHVADLLRKRGPVPSMAPGPGPAPTPPVLSSEK